MFGQFTSKTAPGKHQIRKKGDLSVFKAWESRVGIEGWLVTSNSGVPPLSGHPQLHPLADTDCPGESNEAALSGVKKSLFGPFIVEQRLGQYCSTQIEQIILIICPQ